MVDPICTLMFSVIVLVTTLAILKEALNVLMEGSPHSVDYKHVQHLVLSVQGVAGVHDLHIWSLSLDKLAVSAHVVLGENAIAKAAAGGRHLVRGVCRERAAPAQIRQFRPPGERKKRSAGKRLKQRMVPRL